MIFSTQICAKFLVCANIFDDFLLSKRIFYRKIAISRENMFNNMDFYAKWCGKTILKYHD